MFEKGNPYGRGFPVQAIIGSTPPPPPNGFLSLEFDLQSARTPVSNSGVTLPEIILPRNVLNVVENAARSIGQWKCCEKCLLWGMLHSTSKWLSSLDSVTFLATCHAARQKNLRDKLQKKMRSITALLIAPKRTRLLKMWVSPLHLKRKEISLGRQDIGLGINWQAESRTKRSNLRPVENSSV